MDQHGFLKKGGQANCATVGLSRFGFGRLNVVAFS
jgi:hypothetical protein